MAHTRYAIDAAILRIALPIAPPIAPWYERMFALAQEATLTPGALDAARRAANKVSDCSA